MKKRNDGIDLLRIVSMLGVVIIHILTVGGGIEANNAVITYLLLTIVDCAVNCYALTTGFVYFSEEDKPLRISKYISYNRLKK